MVEEQEGIGEELTVQWATGKRKTAVASVRLMEGKGEILVNGKTPEEYFGAGTLPLIVKQPLEAVDRLTKYDVQVKVAGGGISGQAGAVRHGISKALVSLEEDLRHQLKRLGFLTRDPRMKERKKYGRPGARARFQFSKR
jgi:small subunit ribosomal protein S9